jgi:hypothetical protein
MALTKVKLIADGTIVQSNLHASHGITTADIGENASYLYYTDARARAAVSVSGNALSYNSSTGVITSNFEESPTFTGNVVISGTLDVSGITTFSTDVHVGGASAARFKSDGTNTIVDAIPNPSAIIFRNSGAVEKMRLDSSGNLGIGTTSPSQKLHVQNGYLLVDTNSAVGSGIWMPDINGNPSLRIVTDQATGSYTSILNAWGNSSNTGVMLGTVRNDGIAFQVRSGVTLTSGFANDDGSTRFIVKGDGNVGINNTNPSYKLDVTGSIKASVQGRFANGSASVPSYSFDADSDIGMYRATTNTLGFSTAGTERMHMDSSGNIKVGVDTPLYLYSEQGVAQVAANRVSSNGTIIDTSSSAAYINLYTPNAGSYITFHTANAVNTSPPERMRIKDNGQVNISQKPNSGLAYDVLINVGASPDGVIGYTTVDQLAANIGASTSSNWVKSGNDIYNSNSGNVGIGVTSPDAKLEVYGNVQSDTISIANSAAYIRGADVGIAIGQSASPPYGTWIQSKRNIDGVNFPLSLNPSGSNVGIGTTSPGQKLTVEGALRVSSAGDRKIDFLRTGGNHFSIEHDTSQIYFYNHTTTETALLIKNNGDVTMTGGNVGIGTTSPNTKLDVHGTTGTKNTTTLNNQTSTVYETSIYFTAGVSATSNHYITTTSVFPPVVSGGTILVEVAASGYGSAGSNGFVFKYIAGGYGGHYNIPASYHPTEIIADTHTGNCDVAIYYPNSTTIGITVTNNQATYSIAGVMRVKITTTYS